MDLFPCWGERDAELKGEMERKMFSVDGAGCQHCRWRSVKRSVLTAPELSVWVASPQGTRGACAVGGITCVLKQGKHSSGLCTRLSLDVCICKYFKPETTDNTRHPHTLEPHVSEDILRKAIVTARTLTVILYPLMSSRLNCLKCPKLSYIF